MASNDLNNTLAPRNEARGQSQIVAARPENSGADRLQQASRAIVRGAFSDAMRRSRSSGESRIRIDPQAAGAARRALSMLDAEDADLNVAQIVPAAGAAIVHHAELRERDGRQDYSVNILRNELQAASAFMEHRER